MTTIQDALRVMNEAKAELERQILAAVSQYSAATDNVAHVESVQIEYINATVTKDPAGNRYLPVNVTTSVRY